MAGTDDTRRRHGSNQPAPDAAGQTLDARYRGEQPLWTRLAWLPIPLLLVILIAVRLAGPRGVYNPFFLLIALHFVFSLLVSLLAAYLIGRSFLVRSAPGLLLLGCGVLLWGMAGVVSAAAGRGDANITATIFGLVTWLAALSHLVGVCLSARSRPALKQGGLWLASGYTVAIGAVGVIAIAALSGRLPIFFVQGSGGTPLRHFIVSSSAAMFACAALLLWTINRRRFSSFTRWYAYAMLLVAVGMFGVTFPASFGDALFWTSRLGQYLGGIYVLIAATALVRDSDIWSVFLEHAAVGIGQVAVDGHFLMVNRVLCRMLDYSESEMLGKICEEITHPEDREREAPLLESMLRGERDFYEIEKRYLHRGGAPVWVNLTSSLVRGPEGWPLYRVTIIHDISERKRTEEALIRSEKLASVGRMAATISHEINNPLEAVTNLLYLAKIAPDSESVRRYLEMADGELNRVAHITRQSLGFYRESNAPELTSVNGLLESTVDLLKSRITVKRALIEKQWNGEVKIVAVAGELRQVLSNLLANSLDAIADQGTIKLRVSTGAAGKHGDGYVRITVADNGKGIDARSRSRLFEAFFTTKGATGTGLGLWVSKQIVEKHGGTIRMRSSDHGAHSGTAFSVVLPLTPATGASNQAAAGGSGVRC